MQIVCIWDPKKSATNVADSEILLLHQQHLASPLDLAVQPPLVMRGQPGVLARQNSALVRHELFEQCRAFEIQGVDGEIDLWFGPLNADFAATAATAAFVWFVWTSFAWHGLIYLISR